MKLSISNIGWKSEDDLAVYTLMKENGFFGLEIAPTRIFVENPYEKLNEAKTWADDIKEKNGFSISSMQSIWFGRQENIFAGEKDRKLLFDYTKKAIDFAEAVNCNNLVFGCPRNRNVPVGADKEASIPFFKELGDYAAQHNTILAMEANPPIYNTNYINTTQEAFTLVKQVNSQGFKVNLDLGTVIANNENLDDLVGNVNLINHVHVSEPGLKMIEKRDLHNEVKELLQNENYQDFVSIEMNSENGIDCIEQALKYVKEVFS